MEFPEVGSNCAHKSCNRLVRCSGCQGVFCKDHYTYTAHSCPDAGKDVQVPICPLCGTPVPCRPEELPDIRVGQHIDTACQSKPALELKGKVFPNACSMARCKRKELILLVCDKCHRNFCVKHRNELDHQCDGPLPSGSLSKIPPSGAAAIFRAMRRNKNANNCQAQVSYY
ncbi:unnamed protein product [Protopolystoma xenopodis]|uniref:AN1-type domain-containing protein n=1 Tax=Protopolystoma xenopodis TaxID=117903 RepID=A0A3S5CLP1_9PLAT|nr:unnamed protein product [Protopolystoma xenopodis]